VAGDPAQLAHHHSQVAGFFRQLQIEELLHGQGPAQIHRHPRQIIHAIGVGDPLPGRHVLADLFGAAVQVADVRGNLADHLAIGPQRQPQHAVRTGMLRAHVDQHLVGFDVAFDQFVIEPLACHRVTSP